MSRYGEGCDDEYDEARVQEWNDRVRDALRSEQGRERLAAIRAALEALPEKRLISGALCTAGGVDAKLPAIGDEQLAALEAKAAAWCAEIDVDMGPDWPQRSARMERSAREDERERFADVLAENGGACGVCLIGAYLWHRKVTGGASPEEAFAALPAVLGEDGADPMTETADLGTDAGLPYELAWELAYRNDETFGPMTPEERWTAFLAWIDGQLAGEAARDGQPA